MATRVRLYAPGVVELQARADQLRDDLAEQIADDMRRFVAVLTGALRGTIRTVSLLEAAQIWFGNIAEGIDYHLYQEYGTSRMAAQPYARPAIYQYRAGLP